MRHSLHVLTTSGIHSKVLFGSPAARSVRVIAVTPLCHHRMCSFRSSRCTVAGVPVRSARSDELMSKRVQSLATGVPAAASWNVLRAALGFWSGPRPARSAASRPPGSSVSAASRPLGSAPSAPLPESGREEPADVASAVRGAAASSPAPRSVPSGNCACRSPAGVLAGGTEGFLGCRPVLRLSEVRPPVS